MANSNERRYLKLNKEFIDYIKENFPNSFILYLEQIDNKFYNIALDLNCISWIENKLKSPKDNKEKELLNNLLAGIIKNQIEEDYKTDNSTKSNFWIYPTLQISFIILTILLIALSAYPNNDQSGGTAYAFSMFFIIGSLLFFDFIICGIGAIFFRKDFFINNFLAGTMVLVSLLILSFFY